MNGTSSAPYSGISLLLVDGVVERAAAGDALGHAPARPCASSSDREARKTACGVRKRSISADGFAFPGRHEAESQPVEFLFGEIVRSGSAVVPT